jgi:hypothetical protein
MSRIKVEYDAYNRSFKLSDRDFGSRFDDDAVYEVVAPISLYEIEEDPVFQSARA